MPQSDIQRYSTPDIKKRSKNRSLSKTEAGRGTTVLMMLILSLSSSRTVTSFALRSPMIAKSIVGGISSSSSSVNRISSGRVSTFSSVLFSTSSESTTNTDDDTTTKAPPKSTLDYSKLSMETITSLCKRRGIIYPSSEIYGGMAGFYDYGPLGVELKNEVKRLWWNHFVRMRDDVVGLDSSIVHNPKTWESSGEFLKCCYLLI